MLLPLGVPLHDLLVGVVADGVVALVQDQEVDPRHGEEAVVEHVLEDLVDLTSLLCILAYSDILWCQDI